MSIIVDALKKTQSDIDKKPYANHAIYGDIEIPNSGRQDTNSHTAILGQKKIPKSSTSKFKNPFSFSIHRFKKYFSTLNRQHIIGLTIILCLCGGIWLGYQYDRQITHGIANATNSIEKHIPTTPPKISTTAAPEKLTLNGTVLTGSKRDAMINNHLYHIGDIINGYKIVEIHYDQVVLLNLDTKETRILTTNL